jgi:tetratricopeptide (TPR) repeat protein
LNFNAVKPLFAALLATSVPAFVAACGEEPPAKAPTQPSQMGQQMPFMPPQQFTMPDASSAANPNEIPGAPRPSMNPQAQGLYMQALNAFSVGDLVNARAFFQQATQADPRAHQAFYSLGVVQDRLRDPGAAASYKQAFTLVPDYEPAILGYAMHLAKKGALGEADRILTEKRGQMPKSAAVAATLAEVKSLQKDSGSAQRIAQEALKLNPDYRPAMVIIARDHYRNRRLDLALYALQAILDGFEPVSENPPRDRGNPEAHLLRGLIWREQGLRAQAMEEFRKAIERRPDLVEARVQRATLLLEAGNPEEALPVLEYAVRFDADNLPAHLALGDVYRLLGRINDAKREFDWVLAREPGLPQVHYNLGLLYLFAPSIPNMTPKQQVGEAITELKKFQEVRNKGEPDDSDELLNRAKLKEAEINAALQPGFVAPPEAPAAPAAAPDGGSPADAGGKG